MPARNAFLRLTKPFSIVLAAGFLWSCGGGNGGGGFSGDAFAEMTNASVSVRQQLATHLKDRYLWYADVPELDLTDSRYQDLTLLLDDMRKSPEDRFSGFVDAGLQQQRVEQGVSGSFGIHYMLRENSDPGAGIDIRVAGVEDFSSVAQAGLQRGDRIIAAQGVAIDELGFDGFGAIFSEPGIGVQRSLTVRHPDGQERVVNITRTEHTLSPVRKAQVFTHPLSGRRVGYVLVDEFIRLTTTQLESFRADFANAGLDDLIVDLRYNGGGLVAASRDLASSVYGQAGSDAIYTTLQRNDKYAHENYRFRYRQFDNALTSLQRVFVLTTGSTCSASEEVINGLKPFMEVVTIGTTSCGKPYASRAYNLIPDVLAVHVLESRSVNADGEGDFYDGFAPVCEAIDDPVLPYDDPQESLISVALYYAENSSCPPTEFSSERKRRIYSNQVQFSDRKSTGAIYEPGVQIFDR